MKLSSQCIVYTSTAWKKQTKRKTVKRSNKFLHSTLSLTAELESPLVIWHLRSLVSLPATKTKEIGHISVLTSVVVNFIVNSQTDEYLGPCFYVSTSLQAWNSRKSMYKQYQLRQKNGLRSSDKKYSSWTRSYMKLLMRKLILSTLMRPSSKAEISKCMHIACLKLSWLFMTD